MAELADQIYISVSLICNPIVGAPILHSLLNECDFSSDDLVSPDVLYSVEHKFVDEHVTVPRHEVAVENVEISVNTPPDPELLIEELLGIVLIITLPKIHLVFAPNYVLELPTHDDLLA